MSPRIFGLALLAVFALAPRAQAQDWGDDSEEQTPRHHHRDGDQTFEEELAEEHDPNARDMARMDDPRTGLGAELTLSLALLDSQGGKASFGVRANWAPGFLWTEPENAFWREALLLELSYDYAGYSNGTKMVNTHTGLHYLNLHAMFGLPVRHVLLLYGALGPGMTVETVDYTVQNVATPLKGLKFNLAYGLGTRLHVQVNPHFAFVSRLEFMRYRRGDQNDSFLTLSLGGAF